MEVFEKALSQFASTSNNLLFYPYKFLNPWASYTTEGWASVMGGGGDG